MGRIQRIIGRGYPLTRSGPDCRRRKAVFLSDGCCTSSWGLRWCCPNVKGAGGWSDRAGRCRGCAVGPNFPIAEGRACPGGRPGGFRGRLPGRCEAYLRFGRCPLRPLGPRTGGVASPELYPWSQSCINQPPATHRCGSSGPSACRPHRRAASLTPVSAPPGIRGDHRKCFPAGSLRAPASAQPPAGTA